MQLPGYKPQSPKWKISLESVVTIVVLIFVIVNILAFIINPFLAPKNQILLGPAWIIIFVAVASYAALAITKKLWQNAGVSKKDLAVFLIIVALAIVSFIYFEQVLPEAFEPSSRAFRVAVGLP